MGFPRGSFLAGVTSEIMAVDSGSQCGESDSVTFKYFQIQVTMFNMGWVFLAVKIKFINENKNEGIMYRSID